MTKIKKKAYATKKQSEPELMNAAHRASALLSAYRKQAIIAASAIAVILVLVFGYRLIQAGNDKKASMLLSGAYQYYNPSGGAQPDYKNALKLYTDIRNKYSGTPSAAAAQYYVANCLVALGQLNDALREYQLFEKKYSGEKELAGLVYQRMGYVYNALGNRDQSVKAFEQSEATLGPGAATIELARLYEQAGKKDESDKKYKLIGEKLQGTSWDLEAKSKVKIDLPPLPPVKEQK